MSSGLTSGFFLSLNGEISGVQITGADDVYCKFSYNYGVDWKVMHGLEHGITQVARNDLGSSSADAPFVWNYPLELSFRTTNAHGWPQMIFSVYKTNFFGSDVIAGYGCTHVPTTPGRHVRYVRLYAPVSSSLCQRITSWFQGTAPEFFNPKFISQGKAREVTRVRSNGCLKIVFNVTTTNLTEWGYENSPNQAAISRAVNLTKSHASFQSKDSEGHSSGSGSVSYAPSVFPSKPSGKAPIKPLYQYDDFEDENPEEESDSNYSRTNQNVKPSPFSTLTSQNTTNRYDDDPYSNTHLQSNRVLSSSDTPRSNRNQQTALGSPMSSQYHGQFSPRSERLMEKESLLPTKSSNRNQVSLPESYTALSASTMVNPKSKNRTTYKNDGYL